MMQPIELIWLFSSVIVSCILLSIRGTSLIYAPEFHYRYKLAQVDHTVLNDEYLP